MTRRNWQVSSDPAVKKVEWVNKRTGKTEMVPEGIDPGWDTNPGRKRKENLDKYMQGKLADADPKIAEAARKDIADYQKGGNS
jgi:hypothetical protein